MSSYFFFIFLLILSISGWLSIFFHFASAPHWNVIVLHARKILIYLWRHVSIVACAIPFSFSTHVSSFHACRSLVLFFSSSSSSHLSAAAIVQMYKKSILIAAKTEPTLKRFKYTCLVRFGTPNRRMHSSKLAAGCWRPRGLLFFCWYKIHSRRLHLIQNVIGYISIFGHIRKSISTLD